VKNPKIELFSFRMAFTDHDPTPNQINTAKLFQVEEDLKRQGLLINQKFTNSKLSKATNFNKYK